jgi:hypothetical protein
MRIALIFTLVLMGSGYACAWHGQSPTIEVLVDGTQIPRYYHQEITYVEAIKGKEYSIRIFNPLGERVAVALSVDGLNTINAQHTAARLGPKWVLEPYQTVVINGWQVNSREARRFFFTTEAKSYGARLDQIENLGLISAAFFRERDLPVIRHTDESFPSPAPPSGNAREKSTEQAPAADNKSQKGGVQAASRAPQTEYAATGIGGRVNHDVQRVYLNLEDRPFATVDLRYEFRPILVRLGVIPRPITGNPLVRRERARGFSEDSFCPEP